MYVYSIVHWFNYAIVENLQCRGGESNSLRQPLPRLCWTISSSRSRNAIWSWALMRDYCWDSLASLYTFPATIALRGLARDCFIHRIKFSPSSPSFSQLQLLEVAPKSLGLRSTNELPRRAVYNLYRHC